MNNYEKREMIYTSIAACSSVDFSDKIRGVISSAHNSTDTEISRAETVLNLLKIGFDTDTILYATKNQIEKCLLATDRNGVFVR